jgi:hypothetical protein
MDPNLQPAYEPSTHFEHQNGLYGNHFRFVLEALPDLTFFAQSINIPGITIPVVPRANPFVKIPETGDHLDYGQFTVSYLIDGAFKTYQSLYWWIRGYGFPHSYEEVKAFRETRAKRIGNVRPQVKDLEKTLATLFVLQPDTEKIIAEVHYTDVFPTTLGEVEFSTTDGDAPVLKTVVSFAFTDFELVIS